MDVHAPSTSERVEVGEEAAHRGHGSHPETTKTETSERRQHSTSSEGIEWVYGVAQLERLNGLDLVLVVLLVPLSVVVGVVVFWVSVGVVAVVTPGVPVDPVQAVHHAESIHDVLKWVVATEEVSEHVEGVSEDEVREPVDVDLWTPSPLELSLVSVPTVGLSVPSTPVGLGVQALATVLVISTSLLII